MLLAIWGELERGRRGIEPLNSLISLSGKIDPQIFADFVRTGELICSGLVKEGRSRGVES